MWMTSTLKALCWSRNVSFDARSIHYICQSCFHAIPDCFLLIWRATQTTICLKAMFKMPQKGTRSANPDMCVAVATCKQSFPSYYCSLHLKDHLNTQQVAIGRYRLHMTGIILLKSDQLDSDTKPSWLQWTFYTTTFQWDFQGPPIMGPPYGKLPILFPYHSHKNP